MPRAHRYNRGFPWFAPDSPTETAVRFGLPFAIATTVCLSISSPAPADNAPDFARDVLPILKAHCYQCHDVKKQKAGYRLDVRSRALKGGESGKAAITASKPEDSDVIRRITSTVDDVVMPPSGKRLTDAQVTILKEWVKAGAVWPDAHANENLLKA